MSYRAFDGKGVPSAWHRDFAIPDEAIIEGLDDATRAAVERYRRESDRRTVDKAVKYCTKRWQNWDPDYEDILDA